MGKTDAQREDAQVVAELKRLARLRSAQDDERTRRRTGEIYERFASSDDEGKLLRAWMAKFKDRQARARDMECRPLPADCRVEGQEQRPDETEGEWVERAYRDQPTSESIGEWVERVSPSTTVVRDECGLPAIIDVVAYLDRLAIWLPTIQMAGEWQRSKSPHLGNVAKLSRKLAAALEADGPEWPCAIDLFDRGTRPTWTVGSFSEYRRAVYDPLHRQTLSRLLMNLAAKADSLIKLNKSDPSVRYSLRPNAKRAHEVLSARLIRDWFRWQCPGEAVGNDVVAAVINMSGAEFVTVDDVKDWLRRDR